MLMENPEMVIEKSWGKHLPSLWDSSLKLPHITSDSSSDSEEEDSGQFYSLHEAKQRQRRKQRQEQQNRQSKLCVQLTVGSGRLTTYAPLRVGTNLTQHGCMEIYYPPEMSRLNYWGLGVFLLQYFPLVNIWQYSISIA